MSEDYDTATDAINATSARKVEPVRGLGEERLSHDGEDNPVRFCHPTKCLSDL